MLIPGFYATGTSVNVLRCLHPVVRPGRLPVLLAAITQVVFKLKRKSTLSSQPGHQDITLAINVAANQPNVADNIQIKCLFAESHTERRG